jgi:hypothetical protein
MLWPGELGARPLAIFLFLPFTAAFSHSHTMPGPRHESNTTLSLIV